MTGQPAWSDPVAAHQQALGPSVFAGRDVAELGGMRMEPGSPRPVFEQDLWDLSGWMDANVALQKSYLLMDFRPIRDPRWRLTAKELIGAMMAPAHPAVLLLPGASRKPMAVATCARYLRCLKLWFSYLEDVGVRALVQVDQDHCDRYLQACSRTRPAPGRPSRPKNPGSYGTEILAAQVLAVYGDLFTADRYRPGFVPWQGRGIESVVGQRIDVAENRTPPLTEDTLRPLITSSLYLVQVLGPHTVPLTEAVAAQPRSITRTLTYSSAVKGDLPQRYLDTIRRSVDEHIDRGEPLSSVPDFIVRRRIKVGWTAGDPLLTLNTGPLAIAGGMPALLYRHLEQMRPELEAAVAQLGTMAPYARNAAQVPKLHSHETVPWTTPLHYFDVLQLSTVVSTATLLLTLALTGMRDSEVRELTVGSRQPPQEVPGGGLRYRLSGRVIKGRGVGGEADEWVVVPEVDRALALAEQLARREPGQSVFKNVSLYNRYRNFREWVNSPAGQRLGLPPIPPGPVNSRVLRRTLAVELAHRPHGLMAAKVQLKHISVVTTEGYTARPGGAQARFQGEVREMEEEHHLQLTVAAFRDYQAGHLPAGPGAKELVNAFAHVDAALAEQAPGPPTVLDNDRRIENLLARQAGYLHQGPANYCWFRDPSKALCLKLAGTPDAKTPLTGLCDSARCPQATHHPCHLPAWQTQLDNGKVLLGNPRVPPLEQARIAPEVDRAQRVVDTITRANPLRQEQCQ